MKMGAWMDERDLHIMEVIQIRERESEEIVSAWERSIK